MGVVHRSIKIFMNEKINIHTSKISKDTFGSSFFVHRHAKKSKGFLMAEAILSLFVLATGLTTVLALISSSLKDSFTSRDTIIAVELAQEGVELIRNVRDNRFLNNSADPFDKFDASKKHCRIDYTVDVGTSLNCLVGLGSDSVYSLSYNGSGFYSYGSGTASRFYRYVYVDYNNVAKTATVRSFVYWGGLATNTFKVSDTSSSGSTMNCTVVKKCVFTEIALTNWK